MRIGAICEWKVNAHYRHLIPLAALRARGHEVVYASEGIDRLNAHHRPELLRGCDVMLWIAPLADIPFNRTRSNVKLKEYASAGTPWLASPVGPYAGMGEQQGGRLVADDGWFAALDDLIGHRFARRRLGRKARAWAKTQTIDQAVARWEAVLEEAIERRRAQRATG
jgi:glycosyltransferase involved in cell wall biosynthesis